jgi:hypothetical protein
MKASVKTRSQRLWKEHSNSWRESGLSQKAYCEREGISYRSFVYHHNRLKNRSKKAPVQFIEAKPAPVVINNQVSGLQLILPNGIRIGIGADIKAALLQTVLSVAGAFQC